MNEGDCVIREDRKRWYQWDESASAETGGTSRECEMIKKKKLKIGTLCGTDERRYKRFIKFLNKIFEKL